MATTEPQPTNPPASTFTEGAHNTRDITDEQGNVTETIDLGTDAEIRKERLKGYEVSTPADSYSGRYRKVSEDSYNGVSSNYRGGFYYDSQLDDPYLSMSLHANTKIIGGEWKAWPGECLEPVYKDGPEWSKKYGKAPIAKCIMSEDFSYSIANNFYDYNGGNPIEDLFSNFKPYAPILGKLAGGLGQAIDDTGSLGSSIVGWLGNAGKKFSNIMEGASGYLNKALYVQGTRFTYYNGTQFNFNNMEMKFVAFSDYVTTDGGQTWTFQSVEDYIKTLQPYVMGIYSPYNADFLENSGIQGDAKKFISECVGFQDPPGGFKMDTKNLDNALFGTLRLNIGATWAIENLVIKGMNVNMSRVQAKRPDLDGETVPLYAEISLQLAPASSIVDTGYRNILDHKGMTNLRGALKEGYKAKLEELKQKNVHAS